MTNRKFFTSNNWLMDRILKIECFRIWLAKNDYVKSLMFTYPRPKSAQSTFSVYTLLTGTVRTA